MAQSFKKTSILTFFVALLGAIIGGISWLLLFIMNLGIEFLWAEPLFSWALYPLVICALGGLAIGLWSKRFGPYPQEMSEVLKIIKKGQVIPYHNLHIITISALLPLVFGGNLGPEAGLSGIIAGLCFWFSDRFKFIFSELEELAQVGIAASIVVIFRSPLFAFIHQIEDPDHVSTIPKKTKLLMYFIAIFSGFGALSLLQKLSGNQLSLGRFPAIQVISLNELLAGLPLVAIGIGTGLIYYFFTYAIKRLAKPLNSFIVLKGILGGLVLGGVGIFLPYVMFSGEHQLALIMTTWQEMGLVLLLLTGLLKLILGVFCLEMGWRGGHIFPTIFSGVAIGYAFALIFPIDPIFSVAIITATLTASVMRKPLTVILLLLIFFPLNTMIPLSLGAVLGGVMPIPGWLRPA